MPGLLLLRLMVKYFATGRAADFLYNINDLQRVAIRGGNLEGFMNTWIMVLQGMREEPAEVQLEFIFYEAVQDYQSLKEDIAHYNRLEEGSGGDRSYKFLFDSVNRSLRL